MQLEDDRRKVLVQPSRGFWFAARSTGVLRSPASSGQRRLLKTYGTRVPGPAIVHGVAWQQF
eukprot:3777772-Prorocentrum_lima.AAC.1